MRACVVLLTCAYLVACSAGINPSSPAFAPDPDTEPLPSAPRSHIPDPRSPAPSPAEAFAVPVAETKEAKPAASRDVSPKMKPDPKPAGPAAAPVDCGSKDNPCPMQKLMRGIGAASTPDALEAAFNRIAALSPNAGWQWSAVAKRGAELAKSGDTATAKKQCKICHDQYRDTYKSQYRARKL